MPEDLESLEETLAILSDPDAMRRLAAADAELADGNGESEAAPAAAMGRRGRWRERPRDRYSLILAPTRVATRYIDLVADSLWWDGEDAEHIRTRSARYPGAVDLEPAWTLEAAADPDFLVREPDPKSRAGYTRLIGHSPSARAVLTVIIDPYDGSGVTAWITRGVDLRHYLDSKESRDD